MLSKSEDPQCGNLMNTIQYNTMQFYPPFASLPALRLPACISHPCWPFASLISLSPARPPFVCHHAASHQPVSRQSVRSAGRLSPPGPASSGQLRGGDMAHSSTLFSLPLLLSCPDVRWFLVAHPSSLPARAARGSSPRGLGALGG